MSTRLQPSALAERLGLRFHDLSLLERAVTHPRVERTRPLLNTRVVAQRSQRAEQIASK